MTFAAIQHFFSSTTSHWSSPEIFDCFLFHLIGSWSGKWHSTARHDRAESHSNWKLKKVCVCALVTRDAIWFSIRIYNLLNALMGRIHYSIFWDLWTAFDFRLHTKILLFAVNHTTTLTFANLSMMTRTDVMLIILEQHSALNLNHDSDSVMNNGGVLLN